jgi:hypothetical protein
VPLSSLQRDVLRTLAVHRNPESYVAGSMPLHRDGPRFSGDIDIFHDREERVAAAAVEDAAALEAAGFAVEWIRRGESTKLEWARDSDFRFYPAMPDELFGYALDLVDIATNKALAAAGRQVPRDVLDLLHIHEKHLPLGAVLWAAVGKDPGYSPESLTAEIRRNARYRPDEYEALQMSEPFDAATVNSRLRAALDAAEEFMRTMPAGKEGLLFLEDGKPVQPDPRRLETYTELAGKRHGVWPDSPEIGSAMLERYR